jgi:hypothetical protein
LSVNFASASQAIEWLPLEVVERILSVSKSEILLLVQDGTLRARRERISSASVDAFTALRPLFGKPAPRTFVKTARGVVEEF